MKVLFKVIRQNRGESPHLASYHLDVEPANTILDCLNQIKWSQDGTLAYRKNCRNTICGSCSMRINGRSALACKENVAGEVQRLESLGQVKPGEDPVITVAPMGNMPVIKDLVVDMSSFWDNLEAVQPYVSTAARQVPEREFLQSPQDRDRLNQMGNCILCGACYSECNAREVDPTFVGPHALAKAYRWVADSRDTATEARLETYSQGTAGVWGCTRCFYCNEVCPMDVAPMDQIGKIKNEILQRDQMPVDPTPQTARAIRHRKTMVDLVKQGGWVDERRFGLTVLGNSFRDLKGLFSLVPLGLAMLRNRKFPWRFDRSEGTPAVRKLIETVEQQENLKD
ncbi:succinate dehydrogenase/fumarate reductase iron-sulfur subunit [Leptolyngbya sp. FACHB-261]|uniref:succinate dehydrogenase/fumarate reductase iron-sulfur subunit n=1 Tax=Leptolyngbya sp. FACHB-261 TaxID=2692806 RepID=UPI0016863A86|nr:succinate dehydrogenase/fumarate reductase iron-sulfur subunit [Leptolyngbya sp. FACHB-261]MBD2101087.1 succinate dehydrogenase/fumarate reductase iron-sulfur subunit [Leptolyngbya sp. FACHB-261]